jgi:sigma-E factor negative regulatory protein RseA
MSDIRSPLNEQISALMDGAVSAQECVGAVQQILADPEGDRVWHRYHVIGDALRSVALAPVGDDQAFWDKLSLRLDQEPAPVPWSRSSAAEPLALPVPLSIPHTTRVAANAPVWKWKLLAGAACSALVAVVGLGVWTQQVAPSGVQVALQTVPQDTQAWAAVEGDAGVMLRDPHLDQLMAAHQQFGGHSALQAPSGFLRNATYQGPAR